MKLVQAMLAATIGTLAITSAAPAVTVATFADPAAGPATPLFAFNAGTGVLTGGWVGQPNLLLQTPGLPLIPDFANAQFTMSPISATGAPTFGIYPMGGGSINFFDSTNAPLLTITFSNATLLSLGFGASDFRSNNVTFTGPIMGGFVVSNEAFSFSFANPATASPSGSYTVTSSFTSSADLSPIPAPASAALLGLGGLVALRRRR